MTERVVLAGGLAFDGRSDAPYRCDVAIQDGSIVELGADLAGGRSIDVTGRTVMPGFIDCHAHVAFRELTGTDEDASRTMSYLAFAAVANLQATLDGGVTTVRDAAGADAGFRRAIDEGLVRGPRLLVSLMQLSPTAGPNDARTPSGLDAWIDRPGIPRPVADGVDGLRAKVREFVQAGADVIKVFATGHFAMPRGGAHRQLFRDDELRAIVEESAAQGVRVMAHAHGAAGVAAAARAGVASIEHGFYADDDSIEAMAEHGTVLVPTLLASVSMLQEAGDDESRRRAESVVEGHRRAVRRAHLRGVPIAMGTDCPVAPHGRNLDELRLLVECGLSPAEALHSATSIAATLLGLEAEIGSLARGLRADLVVVEGDPLDLANLPDRIVAVFRDGVRVGPTTSAGDEPGATRHHLIR